MNANLPSLYAPATPEEFIGPAGRVARILQRVVKDAQAANNAPIKILFNGEPGIGKSSLARYLIQLLGCELKWSVRKLNGTSVRIETVEELAQGLRYPNLFSSYHFIWIEEADAIPAIAQVRFLTLLDDLPNGCVVVCTSNCKIHEFRRRFETRFKIFEIDPPAPHEIQTLLRRFLNDPRAVANIATLACGNVRQALLDTETTLQAVA